MTLNPLLDSYDTVLLDLDGCVWLGDHTTRGAPQAIAELRAAGKQIAFVTNIPSRFTGTAGEMQVKDATLGGVFNMGGTAVANYVSILERLR